MKPKPSLPVTTNTKTIIINNTLEGMVKVVEEYGKWIHLESEKDEKEMSIYQVGRLNPKNELMKNIEELTRNSVAENLNLLLKHEAF